MVFACIEFTCRYFKMDFESVNMSKFKHFVHVDSHFLIAILQHIDQ